MREFNLSYLSISLIVGLVLSGCDSASLIHESRVIPYTHSGVPWMFDADGYQYLIDTGTPRSFVVPSVVGMPDDVFTTQALASWDVQGLGIDTEVVVTWDLPPAIVPMIGANFGGILGADVLARQPFMLDPYRSRFILDDDGDFSEWLSETEPAVRVPIEVVGGGTSCMTSERCFEHDGLRVLVEVEIEGESVLALLDTGATYTAMGLDLFERLEAGRSHPRVSVTRGWDVWDFARVADVTIGNAVLTDVPVRVNPSLDTALARLNVETNRQVELLLGHSFLLYFATGIDHEAQMLTLARYTTNSRVETEMFESFGIWLVDTVDLAGCFAIGALALDTPTLAAGLAMNDCILAINGTPSTELTFEDVERSTANAALGEPFEFVVTDKFRDGLEPSGDYGSPPRTVTLTKYDLLPRL